MERIVDCKGLLCPQPLILTKRALKEVVKGEIIKVIIDNATSCQNVTRFLADNNIRFEASEADGVYTLTVITPGTEFSPKKDAEEYCEISYPKTGNYIVQISSELLGVGDESLGRILMKGFLNTLPDLDKLPSEIICYNSGVLLARKGTDTAKSLLKLKDMGVKITLCGTCVDFFGIKNEIEVGEISNMLYIAEMLTSGVNIVKP